MTSPKRSDIDQAWLRTAARPTTPKGGSFVRIVDLFCGCGGMTLGIAEGARRLGYRTRVLLALDNQPTACRVFKDNFQRAPVLTTDIARLFEGSPGDKPSRWEKRVSETAQGPHILLGGPPCTGHSDLNNHTRRRDPKNALYLRMARAAEILKPHVVIIENVPPILWDSNNIVETTKNALEKVGYAVHGEVINLSQLGVPQRRRRYILLASGSDAIDPVEILDTLIESSWPNRNLRWAIGDLTRTKSDADIDRPSRISTENQRRIDYLFEKDRFDLPNSRRPPCHQDEDHTYKSMYGRLSWDQPAQTITTGFTSMGQGRFVHPSQRRTLTPHEAARLQTFPDFFDWTSASRRTDLSTMIGNAVPPLLMIHLAERLLPLLLSGR